MRVTLGRFRQSIVGTLTSSSSISSTRSTVMWAGGKYSPGLRSSNKSGPLRSLSRNFLTATLMTLPRTYRGRRMDKGGIRGVGLGEWIG